MIGSMRELVGRRTLVRLSAFAVSIRFGTIGAVTTATTAAAAAGRSSVIQREPSSCNTNAYVWRMKSLSLYDNLHM